MDKTFDILNTSSKFAICGLPLRADTYKNCSFGCKYCFANYRKIMATNKTQVGDLNKLRKILHRIYDRKDIDASSFLDVLLKERITWHCGGMADPFQHIERNMGITKEMIKIANIYDVSILFSTKSDTVYDATEFLNPDLHSFHLSVTNIHDLRNIEPFVPPIKDRINFFHWLKERGFKVGIRMQPFIPSVSEAEIVDTFRDADYFSIEGLKLVPQNMEQRKLLTDLLDLNEDDFIQMGLLNLKPHIRLRLYQDTIDKLEQYGISYSIADNDLHHITKSKCCCGEPLIKKSTDFNNTALFYKNQSYDLQEVLNHLGCFRSCRVKHLFASNRQELGCETISDFIKERFNRDSSPFSQKFQYAFVPKEQKTLEVYNV